MKTIIIKRKLTAETREALIGAVKWLERIDNRRANLPASFLDNCNPAPLAKRIRSILQREAR